MTKGCTGSLEFLGLNDRVRDGVRNRAKVQLIGDFPPPQPLTKEVKSLLTSRCQIQSRRTQPRSLSYELSLLQQTSRYAIYHLTGITLALYCISTSSVAHLHVSKSTRFQCCSQHPRTLGQVSKTWVWKQRTRKNHVPLSPLNKSHRRQTWTKTLAVHLE